MPLPPPTPDIWSLDQIIEGLNSRKIEIDDGIRELRESIIANGLLQLLLVQDNRQLIAGYRRLAALRLAKVEKANVLVFPSTLTPSQIRVINLTENVQRVDLSDPELYLATSELKQLNPDWTRKSLAEHLGKSQSTVTHWLSPDDLIPEARQAFLEGKFGFTKAYAIAKLEHEKQGGLLALTLSGGTRDDIERAGRRTRSGATVPTPASKPPEDKPASVKISLLKNVTITVKAADLTDLGTVVDILKTAYTEAKAAESQGLSTASFERVMSDRAKKAASTAVAKAASTSASGD